MTTFLRVEKETKHKFPTVELHRPNRITEVVYISYRYETLHDIFLAVKSNCVNPEFRYLEKTIATKKLLMILFYVI